MRALLGACAFAATFCSACAAPPDAMATLPFTGTVWAWHSTQWPDGRRDVAAVPARYTVQFRDDGSLRARADCNGGGGRYVAQGQGRLALSPIATTKKGCPDDTQDAAFLRALQAATSYRIDGDALLLGFAGGGAMRLEALR
jgi:heat shock protein HslJ